jgi:RNA recognition motif-containing protein
MKKLYVGNLPFDMNEQGLRELFSSQGEVASTAIITDRDTGQSRGFGFVEMTNAADADKAIEAMNGQDCGGRSLTVNEARAREAGGGGGGGGRSGGFSRGGGGGGGRSGGGGGGGRW